MLQVTKQVGKQAEWAPGQRNKRGAKQDQHGKQEVRQERRDTGSVQRVLALACVAGEPGKNRKAVGNGKPKGKAGNHWQRKGRKKTSCDGRLPWRAPPASPAQRQGPMVAARCPAARGAASRATTPPRCPRARRRWCSAAAAAPAPQRQASAGRRRRRRKPRRGPTAGCRNRRPTGWQSRIGLGRWPAAAAPSAGRWPGAPFHRWRRRPPRRPTRWNPACCRRPPAGRSPILAAPGTGAGWADTRSRPPAPAAGWAWILPEAADQPAARTRARGPWPPAASPCH